MANLIESTKIAQQANRVVQAEKEDKKKEAEKIAKRLLRY